MDSLSKAVKKIEREKEIKTIGKRISAFLCDNEQITTVMKKYLDENKEEICFIDFPAEDKIFLEERIQTNIKIVCLSLYDTGTLLEIYDHINNLLMRKGVDHKVENKNNKVPVFIQFTNHYYVILFDLNPRQ